MTVANSSKRLAFTSEQVAIVSARPEVRTYVEAGPGTGKTAVACGRIAALIESWFLPPSSILLVSFTQTAVKELGDRIADAATSAKHVRGVQISTIDSHAWRLRVGFDDANAQDAMQRAGLNFDTNIERATKLLSSSGDMQDYLARYRHVIVDEAQDVMGRRTELLIALINALPQACGVTVFADPLQAIYGFTTDYDAAGEDGKSFVQALLHEDMGAFKHKRLTRIFRASDQGLLQVFASTRETIENDEISGEDHYADIRTCLEKTAPMLEGKSAPREGLTDSTLLLFRRRVDALMCTSYLLGDGISPRLRMSRLPRVVRPWLGALLGTFESRSIRKEMFEDRWEELCLPKMKGAPSMTEAWELVYRLCGASRNEVDMEALRGRVAKGSLPVEFYRADCGLSGPIVGTIHASKGRQASAVRLGLSKKTPVPRGDMAEDKMDAFLDEESRVLYVGATRAQERLELFRDWSVRASFTKANRAYRLAGKDKKDRRRVQVQVQLGLENDVDLSSMLPWERGGEVQELLQRSVGTLLPLVARRNDDREYRYSLIWKSGADGGEDELIVGELCSHVNYDLFEIQKRAKASGALPRTLCHLTMFDVTTVGLPDEVAAHLPAPWCHSRLCLAPVFFGFTLAKMYAA